MQFLQPSSIKAVRSVLLILVLNLPRLSSARNSFVSFDQRKGPWYVNECFPYLIVLKRGRLKSEFLKEYLLSLSAFSMKSSCIKLEVESSLPLSFLYKTGLKV